MPPSRETNRVTNARNAEPWRDRDGIVFRGPYPILRNLMLEAEPIRAGRAVAPPIKPGMIGEDLDPCANNEDHQEEIEGMQQTQPQRKSRVHRLRGRRKAGVAHEEVLNARHRAQLLGDRNTEDQESDDERYSPQDVDPSAAQPDAWDHTLLRRQPVAQTKTVIRSAQAPLIVRLWSLANLLCTSRRRHRTLDHTSLLPRVGRRPNRKPRSATASL